MTGRMQVLRRLGPFGSEWVVTCPEHGVVAWMQDIWDTDHTAAMNHAIGHVRNEHEYTCPACYGDGSYGGMRSFVEGRIVEDRYPCDECGGTGSIVLMGEPA